MFDQLSGRLSAAVASLRGRGRLTEGNIADSLREVRIALLEADVALPVVKRFIEQVRVQALGTAVSASLNPGQALIGILHRELVSVLGGGGLGLSLDRKSTRLNSSHQIISYAVFCLKKKKTTKEA